MLIILSIDIGLYPSIITFRGNTNYKKPMVAVWKAVSKDETLQDRVATYGNSYDHFYIRHKTFDTRM